MTNDSYDYSDLLDPTVEMENPFVPAPLGDTVVMEDGWPVSVDSYVEDYAA